jgi:hypothetical protein
MQKTLWLSFVVMKKGAEGTGVIKGQTSEFVKPLLTGTPPKGIFVPVLTDIQRTRGIMNARQVMECEAFFSKMDKTALRSIARCIIKLAQFGKLVKEERVRFDAERSCTNGIIKLMHPYCSRGVIVPEPLRTVASSSESAERVYNAALVLAPIVSRHLAADKEPVVRATGRNCIPPPPAHAPQPSL